MSKLNPEKYPEDDAVVLFDGESSYEVIEETGQKRNCSSNVVKVEKFLHEEFEMTTAE